MPILMTARLTDGRQNRKGSIAFATPLTPHSPGQGGETACPSMLGQTEPVERSRGTAVSALYLQPSPESDQVCDGTDVFRRHYA